MPVVLSLMRLSCSFYTIDLEGCQPTQRGASCQSLHQCPHYYLWSRRAKAWGVGERSCRDWSQGKRPVYWKPFRWYWSLKSLYRISSMMTLPPSRTPSSGCYYPPNGGVPREKEESVGRRKIPSSTIYPSWRWYQVQWDLSPTSTLYPPLITDSTWIDRLNVSY